MRMRKLAETSRAGQGEKANYTLYKDKQGKAGKKKMQQHVPRTEEHCNKGERRLSPISSDMIYSMYKQAVKGQSEEMIE